MILSIDIETKSKVDLAKCGVYSYIEDKKFEIVLLAYAFDDEEVKIVDLTKNRLPSRIKQTLVNPKIIKHTFNANFKRVCLSKYLNIKLSIESFRCIRAMALKLGLPHSLEKLREVVNLDIKKIVL